MEWIWTGLILGIILPWIVARGSILADIREGRAAKGVWSGVRMFVLTVPIGLAISWVFFLGALIIRRAVS